MSAHVELVNESGLNASAARKSNRLSHHSDFFPEQTDEDQKDSSRRLILDKKTYRRTKCHYLIAVFCDFSSFLATIGTMAISLICSLSSPAWYLTAWSACSCVAILMSLGTLLLLIGSKRGLGKGKRPGVLSSAMIISWETDLACFSFLTITLSLLLLKYFEYNSEIYSLLVLASGLNLVVIPLRLVCINWIWLITETPEQLFKHYSYLTITTTCFFGWFSALTGLSASSTSNSSEGAEEQQSDPYSLELIIFSGIATGITLVLVFTQLFRGKLLYRLFGFFLFCASIAVAICSGLQMKETVKTKGLKGQLLTRLSLIVFLALVYFGLVSFFISLILGRFASIRGKNNRIRCTDVFHVFLYFLVSIGCFFAFVFLQPE